MSSWKLSVAVWTQRRGLYWSNKLRSPQHIVGPEAVRMLRPSSAVVLNLGSRNPQGFADRIQCPWTWWERFFLFLLMCSWNLALPLILNIGSNHSITNIWSFVTNRNQDIFILWLLLISQNNIYIYHYFRIIVQFLNPQLGLVF